MIIIAGAGIGGLTLGCALRRAGRPFHILERSAELRLSVDAALARYESRRIPRANSFVVRSFRAGQIAQLRAAPLRWLRNRALRAVPVRLATRAIARDMDFQL
jgi:2-polyprenyl-6-methoxyphenol hydroxylase-like FAD-dependent oxidoreductase